MAIIWRPGTRSFIYGCPIFKWVPQTWIHGPLTRCAKLRFAHALGMPGTFSPPPTLVSDPDMHQGTCVTHVSWCMPESLTSGFLWSRWRGKRSRHSRRMRNPQFCVFDKRPMRGYQDNSASNCYQVTCCIQHASFRAKYQQMQFIYPCWKCKAAYQLIGLSIDSQWISPVCHCNLTNSCTTHQVIICLTK